MKPIRVGLIRCDVHGMYYGTLMQAHDALLLRGPDILGAKKTYTWLNGGAYFYHYTFYADPRQMTAPRVEGFAITKVWDPDPEIAEAAARVFHGKPAVCKRFEDVSDDVDLVFIADCNGDGSDHLKLAAPGLQKRVPTFIDKPLAFDVADAQAILNLARRRRTPVLSLSILSAVPEAAQFHRRLPEVGALAFGQVRGGSRHMAGLIHAVSLSQHVFGDGVASVQAMANDDQVFIRLDYGGRPDRPERGVMLACDAGKMWHCAYHASAYGSEGAIHSGPISDFVFPKGAAIALELTRQMVRSGSAPVPCARMIENVAVAEAARKAQETGRVVRLDDVLGQTARPQKRPRGGR